MFRTEAAATKIVQKFGQPSTMYREYFELSQLMRGASTAANYQAWAGSTLRAVATSQPAADGASAGSSTGSSASVGVRCTIQRLPHAQGEVEAAAASVAVDRVVVLIGSTPDLSFVRSESGTVALLRGQGQVALPTEPPLVSSRAEKGSKQRVATHPVYADVDPWTMDVVEDEAGEEPAGARAGSTVAAAALWAAGPLRGDNFVRFVLGDAWPVLQRLHRLPSGY
jgi:hypothetical protein